MGVLIVCTVLVHVVFNCEAAVLQAGTLSGNPLAMTAGIKTLEILDRPGVYEYLDKVTGRLINGILDAGRAAGHKVTGGHINGTGFSPRASLARTSCATLVLRDVLLPPRRAKAF